MSPNLLILGDHWTYRSTNDRTAYVNFIINLYDLLISTTPISAVGEFVNERDNFGRTPLDYAIHSSDKEMVDILLKCGARKMKSKKLRVKSKIETDQYWHTKFDSIIDDSNSDYGVVRVPCDCESSLCNHCHQSIR